MRWWIEFVAGIGDIVPLSVLGLLMVGFALLVGALWHWYPKWIPRRWPRLRWPSFAWLRNLFRRRPRRVRAEKPEPEPESLPASDDEVPELPAAEFRSLADRLAAEGRYAEAIRERLRGMVRELIERGVLEHRPGWTVTELAAVAAGRRPAVAAPLTAGGLLFSDIWYGARPAHAEHDTRMRELARALTAALDAGRTPLGGPPQGGAGARPVGVAS